MNELLPMPTMNHATRGQVHMPAALQTATHVFVLQNARPPPLTCPYTGPFKVLQKQEKYFKLEMHGKTDKISLDRLKPAFLEDSEKDIFAKNSINTDSPIVCYGPSIKEPDKQTESSRSKPTQPNLSRQRKSEDPLELNLLYSGTYRKMNDAIKNVHVSGKRFGRLSRPPDRV